MSEGHFSEEWALKLIEAPVVKHLEHKGDGTVWARWPDGSFIEVVPRAPAKPRQAVHGDIYERGCNGRCWARHIPGFDALHIWPPFDAEWIAALKKLSVREFNRQFLCGSWDVPDGG